MIQTSIGVRRPRRFVLVAALLTLLVVGCSSVHALPTRTLSVDGAALTVELAVTPSERELGLMNRKSMAEDHGMLFIFPNDQQLSFWMKNTSIPLSIAFLSADGTVKTIRDMQPFSLDTIGSVYSVRYALEVNQGYFQHHGVTVGDRIALPSDLPTATQ